jgi:adenylosuccinate lyase
MLAPDTTATLAFMLERMTSIVEGLVPYPERMRANLERAQGLFFSEGIMLALVGKGLGRQKAYELVQKNAMAAFQGEGAFRELLAADERIGAHLSEQELGECFNLEKTLRWAEHIVKRAISAP